MKSMTGFGTSKQSAKTSNIEVSIRSVNGRFLEPRMHIPKEFAGYEADLKKLLGEGVRRGTVDIFITRQLLGDESSAQITVNTAIAKEWANAYKQLAKALKTTHKISVDQIAKLPNVMMLSDDKSVSDEEKNQLFKTFKKALSNLVNEREREGQFLQKDLLKLLEELSRLVKQMESAREEANQNLAQRYQQKIKTRAPELDLNDHRVMQEVVIQLEKSDINEELSRLCEHIATFKQQTQNNDVEGKKLDFYTQELLREVNTIGSKSSLAGLTKIVVEAKTIIERIREQVQNIE